MSMMVNIKSINDNFEISTDKSKLNTKLIFDFLKQSYWANERSYEDVVNSIKHSLCFGMYDQGAQIGFARIITDYTTFAYLADVFVIQDYQGKGLGKWFMEVIFNIDELKSITSWVLLTNDAHGLYKKVGFVQYPYPERVMMKNAKLITNVNQSS